VIAKAMGMFSPLVYEVVFRAIVSWNPLLTLLDADRLEKAGENRSNSIDANKTTKITITKPINSLFRLFITLTPYNGNSIEPFKTKV
jgi:hypothetical protein